MRRTAKILSEIHTVSKTSVWNWIKKFEEKLPITAEKKERNLCIAKLLLKGKSVITFIHVD